MGEEASTSLGLCARITVALVTAKPGLTIVKFWQGIVDIILRAIIAVSPPPGRGWERCEGSTLGSGLLMAGYLQLNMNSKRIVRGPTELYAVQWLVDRPDSYPTIKQGQFTMTPSWQYAYIAPSSRQSTYVSPPNGPIPAAKPSSRRFTGNAALSVFTLSRAVCSTCSYEM